MRLSGVNKTEETLASIGARIGDVISIKESDSFNCIGTIFSEFLVARLSIQNCVNKNGCFKHRFA